MTLTYQRFTAVFLLLIYGSLFLNSAYYCLSVFWCAVADSSWILHHGNAPHTALSVKEYSASKQITVVEHLSYSPDLAPSDIPKDKGNIEGNAF
jgi:hypothetical protein